jgi:fructose-1,6-bisphosphatase I
MAFIVEQAGGRATTGRERVLTLKPTKLHQKSPIFLGSQEEILKVEELYRNTPPAAPKSKL